MAQPGRAGRVDHQSQLLFQLTGQGVDRLLTGIDLAAGLHKGLGAALAHQQGPPIEANHYGSGNTNDSGGCGFK